MSTHIFVGENSLPPPGTTIIILVQVMLIGQGALCSDKVPVLSSGDTQAGKMIIEPFILQLLMPVLYDKPRWIALLTGVI